jgi:hypothetical protein
MIGSPAPDPPYMNARQLETLPARMLVSTKTPTVSSAASHQQTRRTGAAERLVEHAKQRAQRSANLHRWAPSFALLRDELFSAGRRST